MVKLILAGVGSIVAMLGFVWFIQGADFFLYKTFAPKYEQVRHDTFKQSQSYNDGMVQELQSMRYDYTKANAEQKKALASIILHRTANYPCEKMPYDLCQFVEQLKGQ